MALPNCEEKRLIEKFRDNVADVLTLEQANNEMFLVRWLRARELNLEKSEAMLRNAVAWRKENHMTDHIVSKEKRPYYIKNSPYWMDGMDKKGRPICTAPFGKWDAREVVKEGKSNEFIAYVHGGYEKAEYAIQLMSKEFLPEEENIPPVTQFRIIVDWEGFAWTQIFSYQSIQALLQIAYMNEAYYPEMLHSCWFINCPVWLFNMVMGLVKPFLSSRTADKIRCFGYNRSEWKKGDFVRDCP